MTNKLLLMSLVVLCAGTGAAAQTSPSTPDTYMWHGELVSYDAGKSIVTVKAMATGEAVDQARKMKPGDRVVVTWSGFFDYASVVRSIGKYAAGQKIADPFTFAAELASAPEQTGYVVLRVTAPSVASIKNVKSSGWITVTSRQCPADDARAVVAVGPYVIQASQATN